MDVDVLSMSCAGNPVHSPRAQGCSAGQAGAEHTPTTGVVRIGGWGVPRGWADKGECKPQLSWHSPRRRD